MVKFFSNSPHIKSGNNTRRIMLHVCIALLPACIMGCIYFGWKALMILALSAFTACASEIVYLLIMKRPFRQIIREFDFSSLVTGLLLGMALGAHSAWYVPIFGAIFSVIVVKMLFGGIGRNVVNPAVTGRIFVFIAFGSVVSGWTFPLLGSALGGELITGATPLVNLLGGHGATITDSLEANPNVVANLSNLDLFLGWGVPGCIGETCKIALIAGGIYLIAMRVIDFRWPLIYIASAGLFGVAFAGFDFSLFLPYILSGGLILGAFFMATDYTTTPNSTIGNIIYFAILGLITAVLRMATGIEVVSFAILLGNLLVPLIDKFIYPRPFGYHREPKKQEGNK